MSGQKQGPPPVSEHVRIDPPDGAHCAKCGSNWPCHVASDAALAEVAQLRSNLAAQDEWNAKVGEQANQDRARVDAVKALLVDPQVTYAYAPGNGRSLLPVMTETAAIQHALGATYETPGDSRPRHRDGTLCPVVHPYSCGVQDHVRQPTPDPNVCRAGCDDTRPHDCTARESPCTGQDHSGWCGGGDPHGAESEAPPTEAGQ